MEDRQLLIFSLAFGAWALASILIPYFRRQHDLLSARNFLLLGGLLYVAFSGVKASQEGHIYEYSSKVYITYYLYIVVFFAVFTISYKRLRAPGRLASRYFQSWPVQDGAGLWFPMALTMATMAGQIILVQVPGLRALISRMGLIAPAFAFAFALAIWRRNKMNPMSIAVVAFSFLAGAYLAFATGGGRRFLYATLVVVPVCFYWWNLRYRKPVVTLSMFAVLLALAPIGDSAYRAARWYGHFGASKNQEVTASTRWEIFKNALFNRDESLRDSTLQIGQSTTEISMLVCYIFNEGNATFPTFHVKPLHSIYTMLTLPIPRALWEDKPSPLGITLPYESKVLNKATARTNWGPGIVGHSVHDGGILAAALYAFLIAFGIRYLDELLVRHPGNPFLMGLLSSASVQIAGIIRGDLATMVPLTLLCFCLMAALVWATRMVVGVESPWPQAPTVQFAGGRAYR